MPIERIVPTTPRQGVEVRHHTGFIKDTMIHIYVENPDGSFPENATSVHGFDPVGSGSPTAVLHRALTYGGMHFETPEAAEFWFTSVNREVAMQAVRKWIVEVFMPWICSLLNRNITTPVDPDTGNDGERFKDATQWADFVLLDLNFNIGSDGRVGA